LTNLLTILSKSLAAKLIIALMSLIIVGAGISWYTLIHTGRINLINEAVKDAAGYSDLIKKSIRYDMLTFDREAIQRTLDDLKSAIDVKGIKLVSSTGRISHSSAHSEIGRQIDRTARECNGCHVDGRSPSGNLAGTGQWTTYQGAEGYTVLTFIDPIYNEPSCSQAACHVHPPDQQILGILESDFSLASVDKNIQTQMVNTTVYAFALMSVISAILYLILSKFVLKPVSALSKAMGRVAQGDLERTETAVSQDEVGQLVGSFNEMTQELKTSREKLQNWTESLEKEVAKKSDELKKSQDKLIHAEKLAAMGRLTADVAHEIRNPLTAIGGFARILQKKAAGEKEKKHAEIIVVEVARLEKILKDVLTFSSDVRYHLEKHRVEDFVFDVVNIFEHTCSEQSVTVAVAVEKDLPPVLIDREQVRQALSNLITNALEAMPRGGALSITAGSEFLNGVRYVYIKVFDTGRGVDENKLSLIFEPFFTTQERGRSTGLGLSITRKIMEEHGGFIKAEGTKGKGSTFSLYFPLQSDEDSHKIKCWEYMKCGRDKDATAKCPAHSNFGRICWAVAGTFCEGKVQGTFAQKYENCMKCDFYQMVHKLRK
jgi:two-component system NtrC family sensor kinase